MMDYTVSRSFSFAPFSPAIRDSLTSLDQFFIFADNFMVEFI